MDKIVSLCKRRGYFFPGSEIYGGLGGIYDLGPFGVELAKNIKDLWWKSVVYDRDNIVGLDSSILMNQKVWETSGHIESFTDPLVECKNCHSRFRQDLLPKIRICPSCRKNNWTKPKMFNLMFKTYIGSVESKFSETYLRPETAQGIFVNFANVVDSIRVKLPFGIAQIGKGFRNEITIGNFLFRVREFEMMELEYFTYPEKASQDFEYWKKERIDWYFSLGIKKENLRFRKHASDERAHYAKESVDIEYNWPFMDWGELEGIANRTDFDLRAHSKASGKDLSYFDQETKKKVIPFVIEPSCGVGRVMLALLIDSYCEDNGRVILKLDPRIAPFKVAVFPLLSNKPKLVKLAQSVYKDLKKRVPTIWDDRGNIGKRYYAQDEVGTPWCVTVDFDSLVNKSVTVRDRDSTKQERIKISDLVDYFLKKLS